MRDRPPSTVGIRPLAACIALSFATLGCAVVMAANQPGKKDLRVLERGSPRTAVVAELGQPTFTEDDPEGRYCHETYVFEQGYSGVAKGSRAAFHFVADVFTLGLWELVGTPTEMVFDGTEVSLEVLYDEDDRVQSVCVFSGREAVSGGALVSSQTLERQLEEAREEAASRSEPEPRAEPTRKERLSELESLRASGMITEAEYAKKQAQILEELSSADPDQ